MMIRLAQRFHWNYKIHSLSRRALSSVDTVPIKITQDARATPAKKRLTVEERYMQFVSVRKVIAKYIPNSRVWMALVYRLAANKVLEYNTPEEVDEKLTIFQQRLSMTSGELHRLILTHPTNFNQSKEDILERIDYLTNEWKLTVQQTKDIYQKPKFHNIHLFTLNELKQRYYFYKNKFCVSEEKLSKALLSSHYYHSKYTKYLGKSDKYSIALSSETMTIEAMYALQLNYLKDLFFPSQKLHGAFNYRFDKIISFGFFEENYPNLHHHQNHYHSNHTESSNDSEELQKKLNYFQKFFQNQLEENYNHKQFIRFMTLNPYLLNESIEQIKKRELFFKQQLHCNDKEWFEILTERRVIFLISIEKLQLLYTLLFNEYFSLIHHNTDTKDGAVLYMKKLFLNHHKNIKFNILQYQNIIKNFIERKHIIFTLFYQTTRNQNKNNNNSNNKSFFSELIFNPSILWMKPEKFIQIIYLYMKGIGTDKIEEIKRLFNIINFTMNENYIESNCQQILGLLMKRPATMKIPDMTTTTDKIKKMLQLSDEERIVLEKEFELKYGKSLQAAGIDLKELQELDGDSDDDEEELENEGEGERIREGEGQGEIALKENNNGFRESQRILSNELSKYFLESKKKSLSKPSKSINTDELFSVTLPPSIPSSDLLHRNRNNAYHKLLREILDHQKGIDLLKELGNYNDDIQCIDQAIKKYYKIHPHYVNKEEEKNENEKNEEKDELKGWLTMKLLSSKEVEKITFNYKNAKEILLFNTTFKTFSFFPTLLKKLIILSMSLHLTADELMYILRKSPR